MILFVRLVLLTGTWVIASCSASRRVYVPLSAQTILSSGPVNVQVRRSQQSHGKGFSGVNVALRLYNTDSFPAVFTRTSLKLFGTGSSRYTNSILYHHPDGSETALPLNTISLAPFTEKNISVDFISENNYAKKQFRDAPFADSLLVGIDGQNKVVVLVPRERK